MTAILPRQMVAFVDELRKSAGVADFARQHLAGRYGRQLLVGAGLGAGGNVLRHKLKGDTEETGGTIGAAFRGAGVGAAVAGGRILATSEGRRRAGQAVSKTYERELHGLTGKGRGGQPMDLAKAQELGIVSPTPSVARLHGLDPKHFSEHELGIMEQQLPASSVRDLAKQRAQHAASRTAFERGWTHAPGALHGLVTQPGEFIKNRWQSMDTFGKALTGLGVAGAGYGAVHPQEDQDPNKRFSSGLGRLAGSVGYALAPGAGMIGQSILGGGIKRLGTGVGAIADAGAGALHRSRVVPAEEQAQWQTAQ